MINQPKQENLRKGRYVKTGFYYFITTLTKNREKVFADPRAAGIVINSLKWLKNHNRIDLIAAMVMPDHVHFIAQLKYSSLSRIMHSLKSFTANEINKSVNHKGQVWERQYYEHIIRNEKGLVRMLRYCLENPVRKGLVKNFKDYPYWYCVYDI